MLTVLLVAFGGYLGLCATACGFQRALVFPAPRDARTPAAGQVVQVEGGTPMLYLPPAEGRPVVVHFHGNGEQIADSEWLAQAYAARGAGFAAVEYPGYGLAKDGAPSEEAIVAAGRKGLAHLTTTLGIAKERVVLSGQSLGTGVAVRLAAEGWGTRLVLVSPFTSLTDVAARAYPILPVRVLMEDRFDSAAVAEKVRIPVLVVHGTADEVVPFDLGEALAKRLPNARFIAVPGWHHNDIWEAPGVEAAVLDFAAR